MTNCASKLLCLMRNDRMRTIGLGRYIRQAGFLQSHMATGTAIHDSQIRQPDLLYASFKVAAQSVGFAAIPDRAEISVLVVPPLAEKVFCRSNRDRSQKDQADHAKRAHAVAKQFLPERPKFIFHDRRILMIISIDRKSVV